MQKIIVAAKSDNNVIGKDNDLVWNLPADWQFFLQTIEGAYLATGRKSFESAPGDEVFGADRSFAIITRNQQYQSDRGTVVHSIEEAMEKAEQSNADRFCILGGAAIYEQSMDLADEMVMTEVHAEFVGDSFFPTIDTTKWKEVSRVRHAADAENPYDYSFVRYERVV
ncbi:MAG: dihydrofolate reductase [Bacteroidota bacterium]